MSAGCGRMGAAAPVGEAAVREAEPKVDIELNEVRHHLDLLPAVIMRHDVDAHGISPVCFFAVMRPRILDGSPIDGEVGARRAEEWTR